jgi:HK97 family phage major capsid protein
MKLLHLGSEVKMSSNGDVSGYLVLFGDPEHADFDGDFFTPETDFDLTDGRGSATMYFNHGLDPVLKTHKLNQGIKADIGVDDVGVWISGRLDEADKYDKMVIELIKARQKQGKSLGWSSGVPSHLVEREPVGNAFHVKSWSLGADASLTHTPADYRNQATYKTMQFLPIDEDVEHNPVKVAESTKTGDDVKNLNISFRGNNMTEENKKPVEDAGVNNSVDDSVKTMMQNHNELSAQVKGLSDTLNRLTQYMQDEPAIRKSGYYTVDGGTADPNIKSMGDWAMAVKRNDVKRLNAVYGSYKAQTSASGAEGGYLMPDNLYNEMVQIAQQNSAVVAGVSRMQVSTTAGKYPSLDYFSVPTAGSGNSAMASGITTANRAEGGSYTETDATFDQVTFNTNDAVSGLVKASRRMVQTVESLESLLRSLITVAYQSKLEYFILNGTGNSQPLGILNAPALVDVTPTANGEFDVEDVANMVARIKSLRGRIAWIMHPSMHGDLHTLEVGTGGAVWLQNIAGGQPQTLSGYPIYFSEHLPQADNSGCVILADLGAYALFEYGGLYVDYSEHRFFDTGQDAWRFGQELDGKPWLNDAITLAGPGSAYEVSAYVNFND